MYIRELIAESSQDTRHWDRVLAKLCEMVMAGQQADPHRWGMVAAAVMDPKRRLSAGVNYFDPRTGTRVHAERAALDNYYETHGERPLRGSVIITTCSPCSEGDMTGRYAQSCTDLIDESGVDRVYAGFQDPSQPETQRKFRVVITNNPKINQLCERFARTFL